MLLLKLEAVHVLNYLIEVSRTLSLMYIRARVSAVKEIGLM